MLRKEISSYLFEYLKGFHLPTHFLGSHSPTGILVKSTQPVPFQVAVVNTPPDTWKKRFGPMNGKRLEFPVLEYYLLDGGSAGTWINEYHAYAFDLATPDEMKQVSRLATKTNAVLRSLCERRGLSLRSIMISMGKAGDQILLTGELSPVTCKFADNRPRGGVADFGDGYTGPEEPVEVLYSMLRMKV
jgi:phosphoribosylaminoimidazole-succinocarboxamide synthase